MKDDITTIQLKKSLVRDLSKLKKYDRQTYSEIISDLIAFAKSERMNDAYIEFIKRTQQKRMAELWENAEDEVVGDV